MKKYKTVRKIIIKIKIFLLWKTLANSLTKKLANVNIKIVILLFEHILKGMRS